MKWKLLFLAFTLALRSMAQNPISSISISMPAVMPGSISDWASTMPPVTIQASARLDSSRSIPGYVREGKVLVTIKNGSSKVCGAFNSTNAPSAGINGPVKIYRGAEIEKLLANLYAAARCLHAMRTIFWQLQRSGKSIERRNM